MELLAEDSSPISDGELATQEEITSGSDEAVPSGSVVTEFGSLEGAAISEPPEPLTEDSMSLPLLNDGWLAGDSCWTT